MKNKLKWILLILLPFLGTGLYANKKLGKGKAILIGFLAFMFWIPLLLNSIYTSEENNKELASYNKELVSYQDKYFRISQTLEKKESKIAELKKEIEPYKKDIEKKKREKKDKKAYKNWINDNFSSWDGSCKLLKDYTINNLNNPDSFKHLDTKYKETKNRKSIFVMMKFTAENSFGGTVTNYATATILRKNNQLIDWRITE